MELMKQEITVKLTKGKVEFNKDDLVKGVEEIEKRYSTLVINGDEITQAKKDMAELNKLKTMFNRKRIDTVNEFKKPINEFESDMKELEKRVFEARDNIDTQVKAYENEVKREKENKLREFFENHTRDLDFLQFEQVKLNITLTASLKSLETTILDFVQAIKQDLIVIDTQEHKERIQAKYERTLDLSKSMLEVKEEVERENALKEVVEKQDVAEPVVETAEPVIVAPQEMLTVNFTVTATREELIELREFMKEKGIIYE